MEPHPAACIPTRNMRGPVLPARPFFLLTNPCALLPHSRAAPRCTATQRHTWSRTPNPKSPKSPERAKARSRKATDLDPPQEPRLKTSKSLLQSRTPSSPCSGAPPLRAPTSGRASGGQRGARNGWSRGGARRVARPSAPGLGSGLPRPGLSGLGALGVLDVLGGSLEYLREIVFCFLFFHGSGSSGSAAPEQAVEVAGLVLSGPKGQPL